MMHFKANKEFLMCILLIYFLLHSGFAYGSDQTEISLRLNSYKPNLNMTKEILYELEEGDLKKVGDYRGRSFELALSRLKQLPSTSKSRGYRLSYLHQSSQSVSKRYNAKVEMLSVDWVFAESKSYSFGEKKIRHLYGLGPVLFRLRQDYDKDSPLSAKLDHSDLFIGLHLFWGLIIPLSDTLSFTVSSHSYRTTDTYARGVKYDFDGFSTSYGFSVSM